MYKQEQLLTVIIPVYNVEKYINKCLESIINQTYKNLEIILVDDGSTDNSSYLCDEWQKKDSRITVIHKKNGGLSDARNAGLQIAKGELITFVDSDDYVMLDTYEQMIQAINSYEADIAVCGDFFVDENGENLAIQNVKELSDMEVFNSQKALEILCKDKYIVSHAWDKVYRRNVIINERFPTNHNYEDIYVMHKIFLNAKKIVHINQPKYFYVQRKGSIVKTPSIENQKDLLNAYKTRYDELDKIVNNDIKWAQLNILIEVLTVCSQIYSIKNFENIVKFINFNLKQLSLLGYSLSKKRKLKYFFAKSNLNYVIKPTKLKKYLQKRAFNNVIIDYKERKNYKKNNTQNDYNADIFLIGVPEYGNLGDQLIAEAEFKFLNDIFEKKTICQIKENEIRYDFKKVKKNIKDNGIIILQGGGNLGDLWPDQEIIRKKIITYFKNNPIVIMPQSVSIRNPESLNKIKQIYSKENVWLTVRENKSKKILEDLKLINNVLLVPDIALYLPHLSTNINRNGVGICLREDIEGTIDFNSKMKNFNSISKSYKTFVFDTVINKKIDINEREKNIEYIMNYIMQFRFIVTDRLHCMIMAYLTGTPCIVFSNSTGKTVGVYEWIKDCKYIVTCNEINDLENCIQRVTASSDYRGNVINENSFLDLKNIIKDKELL